MTALVRNEGSKMTGRIKKNMKKLFWAGIVGLALLACAARESKATPMFENIPVTTAPGGQRLRTVSGNYIVWKYAVNEAYDIARRQIVHMPGLNIDGEPAIWGNKVVYEGANGY